MAKQRKRKPQRNERDRTHGTCGREPLRYAPMRPECNPTGIMANLDPRTYRPMFTFADTVLPDGTVLPDLPVLADLNQHGTKAKKRPGWAHNSANAARINKGASSYYDKRKG